ncbi:hypothetical protein [Mucilaginibacter gotjawali]|nr:hypothetical protein [Mucilaginibacter gotjawali]
MAQPSAKSADLQQSTYYDAEILFYALHHYNAFPINNGVGDDGSVQYTVIESTTGKILMDACPANNLIATLNNHKFNQAENSTFISEILARHVGLADRAGLAKLAVTKPAVNYADVAAIYKNNNFLPTLFSAAGDYDYPAATLTLADVTGASTTPTVGGGSPVSLNNIAEGLASFYIDRVNEEINEAFFVHFQNFLNKYPELKILFPNTIASLNKIKVTSYQQSLNAIKSAYQTDIKNVMSNASGLASLQKYQELINDKPALALLFVTCDVVSMIRQSKSVEDILYQLGNAPYIQLPQVNNPKDNDYISSIKLAAILSNSFIDIKVGDQAPTSYKWVGVSQISALGQNKKIFNLFMGLLTQETYGIYIGGTDIFAQLNANVTDINSAQYVIYNFSSTYKQVATKVAKLTAANTTLATKLNIGTDIFKQIVDLSTVCLEILPSDKVKPELAILKKIKDDYIPYLFQADSVVYHIEQKEYTSAIFAADTLIRTVIKNEIDAVKAKIAANPAPSVAALKALNKELAILTSIRDEYLKYAVFISTVAEAQSGSDVKKAIDAFALPVGSSRIKKEHIFSWGINSYVGIASARNHNFAANNLPEKETIVTAPIGISANFALPGKIGSMSLYGGIIDIGAIFTYQVNSDKTVQSEIKLGQILSPSIGVIYGFPIIAKYNIPLSFGANYQWGPKLKSVDQNGQSVLGLFNSRFNLFIAVDIPFINFNVSRK